jgi:PhzF family phenazine biosynthesis protein
MRRAPASSVALVESARIYRAFAPPLGSTGHHPSGNPAAVIVCSGLEPAATLAETARVVGLPMTAFLTPVDGVSRFGIRYFSGNGTEFQICGHATVAAGRHVANVYGALSATFELAQPIGEFSEVRVRMSDNASSVELALPAAERQPLHLVEWAEVLGGICSIDPPSIVEVTGSDVGDLLIVVASAAELRSITLDRCAAVALIERRMLRGILVTAPSNTPGFDIENRAFFPAAGIDEDLACGTANCTVLPYWHAQSEAARTTLRIGYPGSTVDPTQPMRGSMIGSIGRGASRISLIGAVSDGAVGGG